jgi:hypothetical protein
MTMISVASMHSVSAAQAGDHSAKTIALFSGLGLVASFCLISFGVDLGAGWA